MKKNIAVALITSLASVAAFAQVTVTAPQVQVTSPKVNPPQVTAPQAQVAMPQSVPKQDPVMKPAHDASDATAPAKHKHHRHHHHKKAAKSNASKQ